MIKVLVIDDEPLAIEILEDYIGQVDDLQLVDAFRDPLKALESSRLKEADVLFLDVKMPHLSGMDVLEIMQHPPLVVFTTAYDEHALESFNYNTVDFLVKPIAFPRFMKAVEKLRRMHTVHVGPVSDDINIHALLLKSGKRIRRVNYNEIRFIKADGDYVQVYTEEERILHLSTMKAMQERLSKEHFIRIHQSYIIPIGRIAELDGNRLKVDGEVFPIGKAYRKPLLEIVKGLGR